MNDPKPETTEDVGNWDAFWQGTGDSGKYSAGGVTHPAILAFWEAFFKVVMRQYDTPRMIDLACGNGAVIHGALKVFGDTPIDVQCIDASEAAINNIEARFPGVRGLVSDARSIPLESSTFDIVTSQFGVEYAGLEAIDEAFRLLAAGGTAALLLHSKDSKFHQECVESLDAIRGVQSSRFIPLAIEMFDHGFKAVRGADRGPYDQAAARLDPAVRSLEKIFEQFGKHVAGDTVAYLYREVGRIHADIQRHDPDEVIKWLRQMDRELVTYAGRMTVMSDAAIDKGTFDQICNGLAERNLIIQQAGPLFAPNDKQALAWALMAVR
jgi:ubiquinone/menaquinone biosynthesis C-methylase UbiE